jgi:hypothetical protein
VTEVVRIVARSSHGLEYDGRDERTFWTPVRMLENLLQHARSQFPLRQLVPKGGQKDAEFFTTVFGRGFVNSERDREPAGLSGPGY